MGRTMKSAGAAAGNSNNATASDADPSPPKIKYRNLRYGCRLCPHQQFSQLSAGSKRNRQSAVECHIRTHHPQHGAIWRRIAYKWGHRVYYDNNTSADVHNPRDLPAAKPVKEEEDDQQDTVAEQTNASGYVYADGQAVDLGPQAATNLVGGYPTPQSVFATYTERESSEGHNNGIARDEYLKGEDDTISDVDDGHPEARTPRLGNSKTGQDVNADREKPETMARIPSETMLRDGAAQEERHRYRPMPHINPNGQTQQGQQNLASHLESPYGLLQGAVLPVPSAAPTPTYSDAQAVPAQQQHLMNLSPFDTEALHGRYGLELEAMAQRLFIGPPFHDDPTLAAQIRKEVAFQYLRETRKILLTENTHLRMIMQGYAV